MESGRAYRIFVRYMTRIGIICISYALVIWVMAKTFPFFRLLNSPSTIMIFMGSILVGSAGMFCGASDGIAIYRKRRDLVQTIRNTTTEKDEIMKLEAGSFPPYMLADSIDHETLVYVKELGGDILDLQERLMKRSIMREGAEFTRRISKLILLGLLVLYDDDKQLYLTSAGLDAVNTPPTLFISSIPESVWNTILKQKRCLYREDWGGTVVATSQALEAAMRNLLDKAIESKPDQFEEVSKNISGKPLDRWSAGNLLGALRKLEVVRAHSLEDFLAGELIKIRNRIHQKEDAKSFTSSDADKCDIYIGLLLRAWFGLK
ncbi:MAG: hypothetical protein K9W43_13700 [Candidatus Thorarchaeota archaeon]|nr:hypothetical protein [Candidatus Thorarchaeota archaeon]